MQHKTSGIVLSTTKYNDKFSIAHIFTRKFGRVDYMLPRASKKNKKLNHLLFSPLSVLSLEVEHLPLRDLQRLKEATREVLLYNIGNDVAKISIALFLSEFLTKVVRETDNHQLMYDFLSNSIEVLETSVVGLANFHITLLLGMTRFLGIYPNLVKAGNGDKYFDLSKGEYVLYTPAHSHFLTQEQSNNLEQLARINFVNMHLFKMSRSDRNLILEKLIDYYRLHLYDFSSLKSLEILKELF